MAPAHQILFGVLAAADQTRIASCAGVGAHTVASSPIRRSLANFSASFLLVLTRSPGFRGIRDGTERRSGFPWPSGTGADRIRTIRPRTRTGPRRTPRNVPRGAPRRYLGFVLLDILHDGLLRVEVLFFVLLDPETEKAVVDAVLSGESLDRAFASQAGLGRDGP